MDLIDYNGDGRWSLEEIQRRYRAHAHRFGIESPITLVARVHERNGRRWVYPLMDQVIEGVESGDLACAQVAIEFIEEDRGFPFGAILKSSAARALRRNKHLKQRQIDQIRRRVVAMLCSGRVPREYREYSKLLRAVGIGPYRQSIIDAEPRNHFATVAKAYYVNHCFGDA